MAQEMEKQKSRASELLSNFYEFMNPMARDRARYESTVRTVVAMLAKAGSHRDLRGPAMEIHKFCRKVGCDVQALELLLNVIGSKLMNDHGWSYDETEAVLNDLIHKMVAMGRFVHGRI